MHPIYLPLVLSLAAPLPAGSPPPSATATQEATLAPSAVAPSATPSPTAAPPTATPPSPTAPSTATEEPTATSAAPSATPTGASTVQAVDLQPIATRLSSVAEQDRIAWTMWVEYQNPSATQDVAGVSVAGVLLDRAGEPIGDRRPTIGSSPVLALAGGHGCFKATWTSPKAAVGGDWTIRASLSRGRLAAVVPAEIHSVDQRPGSTYFEARATAAVTRTTTVMMAAILRDRAGVVVTCGTQSVRVDPGQPALWRLPIGERVLATAPNREILFRAPLIP